LLFLSGGGQGAGKQKYCTILPGLSRAFFIVKIILIFFDFFSFSYCFFNNVQL